MGENMDKYSVLKKFFGYDTFKYPQDIIIDDVLQGKDVIGLLPTGFGKSIIFQVLAMMLDGLSIIVSPLIALMEDQVDKLKKKGIPATLLNSSIDEKEQNSIYQSLNHYKILYVSPERLQNKSFQTHISKVEISMIVIDEAHTLLWAEGFRMAFGQIKDFIQALPYRPHLLALTATATPFTLEKIKSYLNMRQPKIIDVPMDRENLFYRVELPINKLEYLRKYISKHSKEKGIIYCLTRKEVEFLYQFFSDLQMNVVYYHGGLEQEVREKNQVLFTGGKSNLMICTNAFGMGIDIPDIRFVIEYSLPQSIEDLVQQVGRASRDGAYGEGVVLFSFQDIKTVNYFISQQEDVKIRRQNQRKLDSLVDYCLTKKCRHVFLSEYFHNSQRPCGDYCDNCQKKGR